MRMVRWLGAFSHLGFLGSIYWEVKNAGLCLELELDLLFFEFIGFKLAVYTSKKA